MIKFVCMLCHEKLSVQDQHSGKRIKCPKCSNSSVVPAESPTIKFACKNCGKGIRVLQIHAGKAGKCPKCKSSVAVPPLSADPTDGSETVTVVCSMCNEKIRTPKDSQEKFVECPACSSNVETSFAAEPPAPDISIPRDTEEDEYEEEYEDQYDSDEEDEGPDRRLIFAICGAAVVVVLGLIILVTVILPSGSGAAEEQPVSPRQDVADADVTSDPIASNDQPAGTFTQEPPKEDVAAKAPTDSTTGLRDAAGNLDLKLRLHPGQKRHLRLHSGFSNSYKLSGPSRDNSGTLTTDFEFEVEQVDANGVMSLKVTYLTFHEIAKNANEQREYDPSKPDTLGNSHFGAVFSALVGRSFVAKVTPEGSIVELQGLDEMYQQMAEPLMEYEDEHTRQKYARMEIRDAEEVAKRMIDKENQKHGSREKRIEATREKLANGPYSGEENIRGMLDDVIMPFPDEPVGIGESWQTPTDLVSTSANVLDDFTYTLRESEQAAVLVDISSTIEVDEETPASADGRRGASRTIMTGSGQGSVEIDPVTGWMLRKNMTSRYSGETRTAPTKKNPRGATTGYSMENTTTVEPMEPAQSPVAVSDNARSIDLKLRLKSGQRHAMRMVVEIKMVQTPMGQRQEISSVKTTELELEVEDVDPNGVMRLKVTYLAIKEKGQGAGASMQYDSTAPDVSTDYPFGPMYSAMIGQGFLAKVTPEGRMIGLEGVDQMYLAIAETIVQGEDDAARKRISERMTEGADERIRRSIERTNERYGSRRKRVEAVGDMLKKNPLIAAEQIAQMVGNLTIVYPGRAVETGDSWQAKKALFALGTVDVDCTYTLKEKTPAVTVVGVSSKIDLDNELASAKGGPLGSARTTMTGTYEGTVQIDPTSGWMSHKNVTMRCSGEVTMPPNEQMSQGMTVPMTMETVITVEPME